MREIVKTVIGGGAIGLLVSGVLALPAFMPPAAADDAGPIATLVKVSEQLFDDTEPFDGGGLLKAPPRFITEDYVSTEVISKQTVRKIGYGRTEFVNIMTTSSGVYSSDAFDSPNIKYPGIHPNPAWEEWQDSPIIAIWGPGGWTAAKVSNGNSFVDVIPFDGGKVMIQKDGDICTRVKQALYC